MSEYLSSLYKGDPEKLERLELVAAVKLRLSPFTPDQGLSMFAAARMK